MSLKIREKPHMPGAQLGETFHAQVGRVGGAAARAADPLFINLPEGFEKPEALQSRIYP